MNQNTVTREMCERAIKHHITWNEAGQIARAHLELLERHREVSQKWLNAASERDELLPIKVQRDELLDANALLESQLAEARKALQPFADCNRGWMERGERAEIRFDWLQHAQDATERIDAAGTLRAKPEAVRPKE